MTITETPTESPAESPATGFFTVFEDDLYRDIHKGLRGELFAATTEAGRTDPSDAMARADLQRQVDDLAGLLFGHAEHEDAVIQPALETYLPALAEKIADDHTTLDRRIEAFAEIAAEVAAAPVEKSRGLLHVLYGELASFTASYLQHIDVEERVVMPALESAVGVDRVVELHQAILANLSPELKVRSISLMIPVMNIDDRVEMLGGMKAGAPPEVFEGMWRLTGTVLSARDYRALGNRLGLEVS